MKKICYFVVSLATFMFFLAGHNVSAGEKKAEIKKVSVEDIFNQFYDGGLTCSVQKRY